MELHRLVVEQAGGVAGVRDLGALESAVGEPDALGRTHASAHAAFELDGAPSRLNGGARLRACAALVYGYERHDLRRRFGQDALQPPVLSIPPDDDHAASSTHRAAVFLWVLTPWVVIFYAVQALGRPVDAFGTALPPHRAGSGRAERGTVFV